MPTFAFGLPLHVLVVHAVVVLVPMAVLGAIAVVVQPSWRSRWGWPVVVLSVAAAVCIPVATSSGEGLEHQLPPTSALETHTLLGDQLLPFAGLMAAALLGLMLLERTRRSATTAPRHDGPGTVATTRPSSTRTRLAGLALAGLIVVTAVISAIQVVRIGDSGARAAWGDTQYLAPTPGGEDG
jgi:hypothetical protein